MTEAEKFIQAYYESFIQKDWEHFGNCLSEHFTYFTDGCAIQDKTQFVNFLAADNWQGSTFRVTNWRCVATSGNLCLVTYKVVLTGNPFNVTAIETTALAKSGDDFEILHCHSSNK